MITVQSAVKMRKKINKIHGYVDGELVLEEEIFDEEVEYWFGEREAKSA